MMITLTLKLLEGMKGTIMQGLLQDSMKFLNPLV